MVPVGLLACVMALPAAAGESGSLRLQVQAAGDELFAGQAEGGEAVRPGPGRCACIFRYDRFAVENLNQVTILGPGRKPVPLVIEGSSIFREFGKVVAFRFYALASAEDARPGEGIFELRWGTDIKAANSRIERFQLDPALRESYRSLRPVVADASAGGSGQESTATLVVIADSSADYHFLWYLVPIGLIFALLTVRKLFLAGETGGRGGSGLGPGSERPG
jgi:hypothetical protein